MKNLLLALLLISPVSFADWGDVYYCQMTTIYNVDREGEQARGYKTGRFKFKISKTENSVVFGAGGYFDNQKMVLESATQDLSSWSASQQGESDKMFFANDRVIYTFVSNYFTTVLTADCDKF